MKEIKFRLWDKEKSSWYKNSDCVIELDGSITQIDVVGSYDGEEKYDFESRRDLVIVQFTGLKDKNGKDIYEGDILQHEKKQISEVYYNEKCAAFWGKWIWFRDEYGELKKGWIGSHPIDERFIKSCHVKVIGNIFENPELVQS